MWLPWSNWDYPSTVSQPGSPAEMEGLIPQFPFSYILKSQSMIQCPANFTFQIFLNCWLVTQTSFSHWEDHSSTLRVSLFPELHPTQPPGGSTSNISSILASEDPLILSSLPSMVKSKVSSIPNKVLYDLLPPFLFSLVTFHLQIKFPGYRRIK